MVLLISHKYKFKASPRWEQPKSSNETFVKIAENRIRQRGHIPALWASPGGMACQRMWELHLLLMFLRKNSTAVFISSCIFFILCICFYIVFCKMCMYDWGGGLLLWLLLLLFMLFFLIYKIKKKVIWNRLSKMTTLNAPAVKRLRIMKDWYKTLVFYFLCMKETREI